MSRSDGDDQDDMSGPRSLTRAILANKGLTPHRAKAVRNPRVKKRQKFEKAKKKLSSMKSVFKGGLAVTGGRYEGEKSGISKVVKSVQLG
jgi:U3 small nucleolar RNA-associated protein 3